MIDAKDLMLGSVILCNGLRTIINNSLMKDIINREVIWTIEPIPLTEDILVNNCGFKKLGRYTFYRGTFKIHKRKRGFVIRKSIPMIDYLHQLQIAYKVFTGKELEINL